MGKKLKIKDEDESNSVISAPGYSLSLIKRLEYGKINFSSGLETQFIFNRLDTIWGNITYLRFSPGISLTDKLYLYAPLSFGNIYLINSDTKTSYDGIFFNAGVGVNLDFTENAFKFEFNYPFVKAIYDKDKIRDIAIDAFYGIIYSRKFQ